MSDNTATEIGTKRTPDATMRTQLFKAATLVFIAAPFFGELATYYLTGRPNGSLPSSIAMILATICNYLHYAKTKNLSRALKITSFVQLLCYCWGLLESGGIRAEHLVYMPLFPVFNGFLFGNRGAIISTAFASIFCILLVFFEKFGITTPPAQLQSAALLGYQALGSTFFIGFVVMLFNFARQHSEESSSAANIELLSEQILLSTKSKELETSQQYLEEAQRTAKIGNWTYDTTNETVTWSKQMYELFPILRGTEAPRFNEILSMVYDNDRPQVLTAIEKCKLDGTPFQLQMKVVFPNKTLVIETNARANKDHFDQVVSIFGTCQDITEKVQRENEVSFLLDSLNIGIWKWDLTTNSLEWDKNMYKLYGQSPTDFANAYESWENALSPETKAKAVDEINAAVRGEKDFDTTFQVVHKSGKVQEIRTRAFVIRDQNGKALKMHGINVDRNREVDLENAMLQERSKSLQNAKLASLGEMSAGIAHEINNPLAIIAGSTQLLTKFVNEPEKFNSKVESIQKSCERINKIINGLKKFARSGENATFENHSLETITKEVLILTESKTKRHNTTITLDCQVNPIIKCCEVEIEQVLVNLINNAVDAIKEQAERWIKISIAEQDKEIVMRLTDSGNGIPETIRKKLFDPFFTTKPVGEGTGLGLSIAKGILDTHKATINLVPEMQHTCFEIRFLKA